MIVVATMLTIVAAYLAILYYFKRAKAYLIEASPAWGRLHDSAKAVIADEDMPEQMVSFALAATLCAGCGCLTRAILVDSFRGRFGRTRTANQASKPSLGEQQRIAFSQLVINAIYYDSLRAPLSGFLLRRLVMPWLREASEGLAPPTQQAVIGMAESSRRAIRHRAEGRRLLAAG